MSSISTSYGAFELKSSYQKNMFLGVAFAGLFHLVIIGGFLWATHESDVEVTARTLVISDMADLAPPPQLQKLPPQTAYQVPEVAPPSVGIPEAVPDEEAPENVTMATQDELKIIAAPIENVEDAPVEEIIIEDIDGLLPKPDDFVPVEQQPQIVKGSQPEYPDFARKAGLTGKVWVKALVDKAGKVRDVIIAKGAGVDAGFEEAAIEAAYKYVYTPAIANGQPVAIWVLYPVTFTLND
ncbi:MAG: energy transducer TonB [candidate division Zixibacteria bacterium]|nr:energy transducer TonB [candidate division Zixibacteria bacterium]